MEVEEYVEDLHKEQHRHQHYLKEQQSQPTSSLPSSTLSSPSFCTSPSSGKSPLALSPAPTFPNSRRPSLAYLPAASAATAASLGPMISERKQQWLDGYLTDLMLKTYTHRRQPKALLDYKCAFQEVSLYLHIQLVNIFWVCFVSLTGNHSYTGCRSDWL